MKRVLVTGANGQLGCCLKEASKRNNNFEFIFVDSATLDITNKQKVNTFFEENTIDYCINTAAYTNVEKAESEKTQAFLVNAEGVKNIAFACNTNQVVLVHVSTDYVFDGTKETPYKESDKTNPINVYGASKLKGEEYIQEICEKYYIVRTSWLYSQFGHNFYNSILQLSKKRKTLSITTEQTGCPTNANDLAEVLLRLIDLDKKEFGVYHFSNDGQATWFDFAKTIIDNSYLSKNVNIVKTDYYPTFAKRPKYSVLNTQKINSLLKGINKDWKTSLKQLINNIQ